MDKSNIFEVVVTIAVLLLPLLIKRFERLLPVLLKMCDSTNPGNYFGMIGILISYQIRECHYGRMV